MWPYIITFVAVALFPLALAGYGGHLATLALSEGSRAKKKALAIVWGLAIAGILLFGLSQKIAYNADNARDSKDNSFRNDVLSKLQKIIDEPDAVKRKEKAGALKATVQTTSPHLTTPQKSDAPVATVSPTPPPTTAPPVQTTQSAYAEVGDAAATVGGLDATWRGSILATFSGRSPSPGIADSLRHLDEETTERWKSRFKPHVETAHQDAVAYMRAPGKKQQLTPNEIKQDAAQYEEAIKNADAEASMADLSAHRLNEDRFAPLITYLNQLYKKLADYPENPTPQQ
jgi:hypothetical protein